MGLDTNPHNPATYERIVMCPSCGYCAERIEEPVSDVVRAAVASAKYKDFLSSAEMTETSKKLSLSAYLAARAGDNRAAGLYYLMSAWSFEDDALDDMARSARSKSVKYMELYLNEQADISLATILVDALRRLDRFDEAEETRATLEGYVRQDAPAYRVLEYEKTLIQRRDAGAHTIDEVVE
jgi:hypothetical protein